MYYSSGNYEAFARPENPEGIEHKSAYLIGSAWHPWRRLVSSSETFGCPEAIFMCWNMILIPAALWMAIR